MIDTTGHRPETFVYRDAAVEGGTIPLEFDLYRSDEEPARGTAVWLHSGGFKSGSKDAVRHRGIAEVFNAQGYHVLFPNYRLGPNNPVIDVPREIVRALNSEVKALDEGVTRHFTRRLAWAALEDALELLAWLGANGETLGLSDHVCLCGSSAGGITALNALYLSGLFREAPPSNISSVFVGSGAFHYDTSRVLSGVPVLAIHNPRDRKVPIASIDRIARARSGQIQLIQSEAQVHGSATLSREEPLEKGIARIIEFDQAHRTPTRAEPRICAVATVRNEGPFLLEWVAHNLNIGVTDFIVFSNDCDDGSDEILDRLDELGIIRHVPNPEMVLESRNFHRTALAYAPLLKEFRRASHIFISDIDEFLWLKPGIASLQELLAVTGSPDAISFSEVGFGFGGIVAFEDEPVTRQFLWRTTKTPGPRKARRGVKTLARRDGPFDEHSNHRPQVTQGTQRVTWLNGSGAQLPDDFIYGAERGIDSRRTHELASLHHYQVRSAESMLVKYERGDAVRPARMRPTYFQRRGAGDQFDDSMLDWSEKAAMRMANLRQDRKLDELHLQSVELYRQKIRKLKSDPDYSALYDHILMVAVEKCSAEAEGAE